MTIRDPDVLSYGSDVPSCGSHVPRFSSDVPRNDSDVPRWYADLPSAEYFDNNECHACVHDLNTFRVIGHCRDPVFYVVTSDQEAAIRAGTLDRY